MAQFRGVTLEIDLTWFMYFIETHNKRYNKIKNAFLSIFKTQDVKHLMT